MFALRGRPRYCRRPLPAVGVVLLVAAAVGCSADDGANDASTIDVTTTNIAGAAVLGIERDTTNACPTPSPPDSDQPAFVGGAAGPVAVPADPQRILVLDTTSLDAMCALGIWERVIGLPDGVARPGYLGDGIADIPTMGPLDGLDLERIAAARPDVIVGSGSIDEQDFRKLSAIAPTAIVRVEGSWQAGFIEVGAATGRRAAALAALDGYLADAGDAGNRVLARNTLASVVEFESEGARLLGPDSFAGGVLADIGVRRPSDAPAETVEVDTTDPRIVDADLIWVIFDGDAGEDFGVSVMNSDPWRDLGAASDKRTFAVDPSVWDGYGPTAARAIVADVVGSIDIYAS